MRWLIGCALVAGCYQPAGEASCALSCATELECPDGLGCFGGTCAKDEQECGPTEPPITSCAGDATGLIGNTCFTPAPAARILGNSDSIDTDGDTCDLPDDHRIDVCFVAAISLEVSGVLTAHGKRPLVLWSATTIAIDPGARLDVSSHFGGPIGAGGNHADCVGEVDGVGLGVFFVGSGGCGGSFATLGGDAGSANRSNDGVTSAGAISTQCPSLNPIATLDRVRGGCRGGTGGFSVNPPNGGDGGGAVYLMADAAITVAGAIVANGAGAGPNSETFGGGGGGGSGGLIAFDTRALTFADANLAALGGSGSSGAGSAGGLQSGRAGANAGFEPPSNAIGGGQTVNTNRGGSCGDIVAFDGGNVDVSKTGGGGGGGGGNGFILVFPSTLVHTGTVNAKPVLVDPAKRH